MADSFLKLPGDFQPGQKYMVKGETLRAWQVALQRDRVVPGVGLLESQTPQGRLLRLAPTNTQCGWRPFVPDRQNKPFEVACAPALVFLGGGGRDIKHVMPHLDDDPENDATLGVKLDNVPAPVVELDPETDYDVYLIYQYFVDEDPTTDETYARIVLLDDQQDVRDIATAEEKWVLIGTVKTGQQAVTEVKMQVCGPETFGGGGGGEVACTALKVSVVNIDQNGGYNWQLSVSPGQSQNATPLLGGVSVGDDPAPTLAMPSNPSTGDLIEVWVVHDVDVGVTSRDVGGGVTVYFMSGAATYTNTRFELLTADPSVLPEVDETTGVATAGVAAYRWAEYQYDATLNDDNGEWRETIDPMCGDHNVKFCPPGEFFPVFLTESDGGNDYYYHHHHYH